MVGKEWNVVKVNGRAESTNIIDRRNALPPLLRSFEFDGKTIGLDMTGPNPHNGGVLTDQQAIGKYLNDHSYYGLPDNQQTHLASSSLDPRVVDTIIAEAGNNVAGQRAVAAAIINRAMAQGKTPLQIVQQHGQFEGYSNPGSASVKAQQIASVRQNATKAFNDVLTGAVADPLKGGKDFRADASAGGLHAPHGTVSIGGNTFALGNAPSSAVAAIDAVAPVPRSIPTSLSAYADTPAPFPAREDYGSFSDFMKAANQWHANNQSDVNANPVSAPPLPVPGPAPPQSVPLSLTDALAQKFGNSTARTVQGDSSIYSSVPGFGPNNEPIVSREKHQPFVSDSHPLSNAVMPPLPRTRPSIVPQPIQQQPSGDLTSRSVNTIRIDPMTNQPIAVNPIQQAAGQEALRLALARNGSIPTANPQAAQVGLPPGVVPKSVQNDLASIALMQRNNSGSPDDRQRAPVIKPASLPQIPSPIPMPGRPGALSTNPLVQRNSNDVVRSVPYVPPTPSPSHYTDASNPLDIDRLGLTVGPPVSPVVQAIDQAAPTTKAILNPAYTAALKAGQAYTAGGNIVTQAQQNAFGGLSSVPIPAPKPLPPKYITVAAPRVQSVPLPRPRPQLVPVQQPRATGGLLGMLFPGTNPAALSMIGQGLGGMFSGGSPQTVVGPVGGNPNITYGPIIAAGNFAPGSPNASFEKQNGMGSVTNSMAASSRWNTWY